MIRSVPLLASKAARNKGAYLKRQAEDEYCIRAREHSYRARSAFKLMEMDDKLRVLTPGATVVDIGAAPGSWTQVAVERVGEGGLVVAVDLQPMLPINGATVIPNMDIRNTKCHNALSTALEGKKVDVLLTDIAPSPTGDGETDHIRIVSLCRLIFTLAISSPSPFPLSPSGSFIAKIWDGVERRTLMDEVKNKFKTVRIMKPSASRDSSAEMYIICRGLK